VAPQGLVAEIRKQAADNPDGLVIETHPDAPFEAMARAMDAAEAAHILHVATTFGHSGPENWSPWGTWFFDKKQAGFGPMADLGIHKADLVRYLTGKEVDEVNAFYACNEKEVGDVEDNFVSTLKFTDGTLGTLSTSWTVKGAESNFTYLYCANGTLAIAAIPGRPLVAFLVKPKCTIDFDVPPMQSNKDGAWTLGPIRNFLDSVQGKAKCLVPGEDGKAALDIILACDEAARTGKTVKLKH
jgi:predicted dehydrogenase